MSQISPNCSQWALQRCSKPILFHLRNLSPNGPQYISNSMQTLRRALSKKCKKHTIQKPAGALLDRFTKHRVPYVSLSGAPTDRGRCIQDTLARDPLLAEAWVKAWLRLARNSHSQTCNQGRKASVASSYATICARKHSPNRKPGPEQDQNEALARNCHIKASDRTDPSRKPIVVPSVLILIETQTNE